MDQEITITAEPVDATRCKFVVSKLLFAGGLRRFTSAQEADGSPLAERLFAIPGAGVREVLVAGNVVTVTKTTPDPWPAVGRQVGQAIRAAVASGAPPVAPKPPTPGASPGSPGSVRDDELYERVATLFEEQVNPMVARHGGRVELIDVQDGAVLLRMSGGCQGCGMADVTLRQGIEGMLARFVPEVTGVVDVTDHTAGSNPYFQGAKK